MISLWKSFWKGMASIGQGMASIGEAFAFFTIFPPPLPPIEHRFERDDAEAIRKDWESVLGKWEQPHEPHQDPDAPR